MIGRNPFPAWRLPNGKTNATDAQLEIVSSSCERWELACAALVVIAVVAEVIIAWMHWAYDSSLQQWGSVDTDAAIALGIVGEVAFSRKDAGIQTELRNRSNQKLADAVTAAGEANDRASQADLARAKLEAALAPRTLSKEQYDALVRAKGKITRFNLACEQATEPWHFAVQIMHVLAQVDIQSTLYERRRGIGSSANMLFDPLAFANPNGAPTKGEPMASILREAGVWHGALIAQMPSDIPAPADVPTLIVGGYWPVAPKQPYLGQDEDQA